MNWLGAPASVRVVAWRRQQDTVCKLDILPRVWTSVVWAFLVASNWQQDSTALIVLGGHFSPYKRELVLGTSGTAQTSCRA
jgi:hypothetical protein